MSKFTVTKLQARLAVADADAAIEFYRAALGATLTQRINTPDGKAIHAELDLGAAGTISVKEADGADPVPSGPGPLISIYVDDVDAAAESFLAAGGTVIYPVADWAYGERAGRLSDPFGVQWGIAQITEDLSNEEIQRRTDEMFREAG